MSISDWINLTPAFASAIAAIAAVIATWRAPTAAAKMAEMLRVNSERASEVRRLKFYIFSELLKARGVQVTRDAVAAFNLIDLVFKDSNEVRDAWAELYSSYNRAGAGDYPSAFVAQNLTRLLKEMAKDLGLSSDLKSADLERYYYPNALAEEDKAKSLQQKQVIDGLTRNDSDKVTNEMFPPRPE